MVNAKCKNRNAAASWNRRRFFRNLLLIAAGTALLGLIVFFVFKKKIYEGNHALETEESAK